MNNIYACLLLVFHNILLGGLTRVKLRLQHARGILRGPNTVFLLELCFRFLQLLLQLCDYLCHLDTSWSLAFSTVAEKKHVCTEPVTFIIQHILEGIYINPINLMNILLMYLYTDLFNAACILSCSARIRAHSEATCWHLESLS